MKSFITPMFSAPALATLLVLSPCMLQAAVLIPTDAAAWDRGSGAANGTGNGGLLQTTTLEIDLNKKSQPDDPSVWVNSTEAWPGDFQGQDVASLTGNPWIVYDLGSVQSALDFMYIITNVEANRGFKDIKVYYSSDLLTNTISTWASASGLTDGGANVVDYSFTTGWTQYGGTRTLIDVNDSFGTQEQPSTGFDISGISSARYIGIEGLTIFDGGSSGRAGINQIAFTTVVPEPSSAALLGLAGLALILRRRR